MKDATDLLWIYERLLPVAIVFDALVTWRVVRWLIHRRT